MPSRNANRALRSTKIACLWKLCASPNALRSTKIVCYAQRYSHNGVVCFAQRSSLNRNCVSQRSTQIVCFAQRKLCASPNNAITFSSYSYKRISFFTVERRALGEAHNFRWEKHTISVGRSTQFPLSEARNFL